MITTVQCSIPSQLNNKPRVVVTDFRLHHTCKIIIVWLHSLCGVIRSLHCNLVPTHIQSSHNNKVGGVSKQSTISGWGEHDVRISVPRTQIRKLCGIVTCSEHWLSKALTENSGFLPDIERCSR